MQLKADRQDSGKLLLFRVEYLDTRTGAERKLAAVLWRGAMPPVIRPGEDEAWYEWSSRCRRQ
mgnify:FL=1